jgi:hypothetical protein
MLSDGLFLAAQMIFIIGLSIGIHEIGHKLYLDEVRKKEVSIKPYWRSWREFGIETGELSDYEQLTPKQYYFVNGIGVIAGIIPIVIFGFSQAIFLLLLIPYLIGCRSDIFEMVRVWVSGKV